MARRDDENRLESTVAGSLRSWLAKARAAVMKPAQPDPTQIYGLQSDWNSEVDTILTEIGKIGLQAWSEATDVPPVSRHAFVQAYLSDVQNLLVGIPDEVADLVFAEISEGVNAGETKEQIAARVDRGLTFTGSPRWPNRAKVIAQTEVNRAYAAGTMAAGVEQSRVTGKPLAKTWVAHHDDRVRATHHAADGQTIPVWAPFQVGGVSMMFPGDPSAPPEEVINCRCSLRIGDSPRA